MRRIQPLKLIGVLPDELLEPLCAQIEVLRQAFPVYCYVN